MDDAHVVGLVADLDALGVSGMPRETAPDGPATPTHWLLVARLVGAGLGFLLAVPVVALGVLVAAAAGPVAADPSTVPPELVERPAGFVASAFVGLAYVFDLNGFAGGSPVGLAIAWLVGPIAAAAVGAVVAPSAARAVGSAGLWMGCLTYLGAIAIAPLAAAPAAMAASPELPAVLQAVPILWLVAIAALAPVFVLCLIAGPVWAVAVRRLLGALHNAVPPSPASLPTWPVLVGCTLTFFGWAAFTGLMDLLSSATLD